MTEKELIKLAIESRIINKENIRRAAIASVLSEEKHKGKGVVNMKKLLIIALGAALILSLATFAVLSRDEEREPEPEPEKITLSQTEIDRYEDIISKSSLIASYYLIGTLYDEPILADDPEEHSRIYKETLIVENNNYYRPVSSNAPFKTFREMLCETSKYFSERAVEYFLSKDRYFDRDGIFYGQGIGEEESGDYFKYLEVSPDATISADGKKTVYASLVFPSELYEAVDEEPGGRLSKDWAGEERERVTFIIEDGVEKIDQMIINLSWPFGRIRLR